MGNFSFIAGKNKQKQNKNDAYYKIDSITKLCIDLIIVSQKRYIATSVIFNPTWTEKMPPQAEFLLILHRYTTTKHVFVVIKIDKSFSLEL